MNALDPTAAFEAPVTALVVGASGGIGRAIAGRLAGSPGVATLFATSTRGEGDPRLVRPGGSAATFIPLRMDLADEASIESACEQLRARASQVDLVVNCAGVLHAPEGLFPERRLAEVKPENLARAFAINATGPALLAKHLESLLPRKSRVVLATLSARVGSIGDNRLGGWYAYRASKAAQNMITRTLAVELKRRARGVICVALHPGTVNTPLSQPFQGAVPEGKLFEADYAAARLLEVIAGLDAGDNGSFFAWDGKPIPW